ncbi:MAG: phosphate/phosphite/phosphonate ABC transporter substrate-binding protein [Thermodesulfobacteriota bacterium]
MHERLDTRVKWAESAGRILSPLIVLLLGLFLLNAQAAQAGTEKPKPLAVAVLHCGDAVSSFELYSPLIRFLSDTTGKKMELVIVADMASLERSLQNGQIDFVLQDSPFFVRLSPSYHREHLLKTITEDGKDTVTGLVIVRKDSPYLRIADLADKRVQFGPSVSGVKWVAGRKLFAEHGVLENLRPFVGAGGCCEEIAFNVYFKKVEAGVICDHALAKVAKNSKLNINELRTIAKTDTIPSAVFAAGRHVSPDIINAVFGGCLLLDKNNPDHAAILTKAELSGFVRTADATYDRLRASGY